MTDQTSGFCSSVIGTEFYREAALQTRVVLESSDCHSLDRHDLGAQRDSCAFQGWRSGDSEEEKAEGAEKALYAWEQAVDL